MILILSKEFEVSTNGVIDWLEYYNANYFRINADDPDSSFHNFVFNFSTKRENSISNFPYSPKDFKVVWYRRWGNFNESIPLIEKTSDEDFNQTARYYLNDERKNFSLSFLSLFDHAYWLSRPRSLSFIDKSAVLQKAKKVGLNIPDTYVLSSKNELKKILSSGKSLISKSLSEAHMIKLKDRRYIPYTTEVTAGILSSLNDFFFPSLFQAKIEKKYEIRTFYLGGKFYSMAIFSQLDKKTSVDFRRYNLKKPNRTVPYKLPVKIEEKLNVLMKKCNLETGSIDLIRSTDNKYYFLEINPVGQFGMTSFPCNYQLEKKVAEFLISKNLN